MKRVAILYILSVLLLFTACDPGEKQRTNTLQIVCTTGIIGDMVTFIAGDKANVISLMGAGVDPHLYKTTHGDLEKLEKADIIFYNGLHLEGKMVDVLERLEKRRSVVAVTDAIPISELRNSPQFKDAFDPHVWFDPLLWAKTTKIIATNLQKLNPNDSAYFQSRANEYANQLVELNINVESELSIIPVEQRILITAHDAFYYFGHRYKFEVRGLQGISTVSEFGLQDITELVDYITEKKIKALFVESSVPPRNLEAVIEGCSRKGHSVVIGGTLFSDALGAANTPEGTYIGMYKKNIDTIISALK